MNFPQSRFVDALTTQKGQAESPPSDALPCPYGHDGRIFATFNQLYDHVKADHSSQLRNSNDQEARSKVREAVLKLR
jgi:hypothetical protein